MKTILKTENFIKLGLVLFLMVCFPFSSSSQSLTDTLKLDAINDEGGALYRKGALDSAIVVFKKGLSLSLNPGIEKYRCRFLIRLGTMQREKGVYDAAYQNFFEALKVAEESKLEKLKADCFNAIATLFSIKKDYANALEYYNKGLSILKKLNEEERMASIYNNMGIVYMELNQNRMALKFFLKALNISERNEDVYAIATNNENIGLAYDSLGNHKLALMYFNKALRTWYREDDNLSIAINLSYIGNSLLKQESTKEAIDTLLRAYAFSIKANTQTVTRDIANYLTKGYEQKSEFKKAFFYSQMSNQLNNSILNMEKIEAMTKVQMNYAFEKEKSQDAIRHQMEVTLKEDQLKTEKNYKYMVSAVLVIIIVLLIFVYKNYTEKRKANIIITEQKNLVEQKQNEIVDSINYANRIQAAILSNREMLDRQYPENLIFFQPKDIVSGDFYWSIEHENRFYLAVCDSTGHGVPGAFMSLLNMNFMGEAIIEKGITSPEKVFDHVRERLETTIGKSGSQDGMDGILVCIDKANKKITYAAANNAPILISAGEIREQQKDKIPVGKSERLEKFNLYHLQWQSGDTLYLYTDGYADQFGGPKGKKFKYKRLNSLLQELSSQAMRFQESIIKRQLQDWQGDLEQIDDICVIGIKLT
jgi:serine phosphatase RsbU (regulator of sigma subunit)